MRRTQPRGVARIVAAGDSALLVRLGNRPGPATSRRVLALVEALDATSAPGLLDVTPAYASVLVRFDPLVAAPASIAAHLRVTLAHLSDGPTPCGRLIRIPVCYGGADGPDLAEVASQLGISASELIQRHTAASYRVAFLGFLAGFPYLIGLPSALAVPRLATPRTHVAASSIAIAERQAGVYPVASPGGWRILGHTPLTLFDPTREPPSLLAPGDRVRFYAVVPSEQVAQPSRVASARPVVRDMIGIPWLRTLQPGMQTTIQDGGRVGYSRYGVAQSGAADPDALALGNALLANGPDAAALEMSGGAASFEILAPCVVAITGAPCAVTVNERRMPMGVTLALAKGDALALAALAVGMRVYLCVAGGVAVPRVMGSRATDQRACLGGLDGRRLRTGDTLNRIRHEFAAGAVAGRTLPYDLLRRPPADGQWVIRILPGPHATQPVETFGVLLAASFTVDARSDRVGVRLRRRDGACLAGGQTITEGMPRGAVQLPPDGEPVMLSADAQATGGYRVPAVVISADHWKIGQLRPGDTVRFRAVSEHEALAALRERAEAIARVARQPSPARLLRGFAEWADETAGGDP